MNDAYYMEIAKVVALASKDRSTKVGCVIVAPSKEIRTTGYNGFPRGVNDDVDQRHQRPDKYLWTEHAERNAIYNAARNGVSLIGCYAYLPWFPCMDCARGLIQAGIVRLVCHEPNESDPKWGKEFQLVKVMLQEAGVKIDYIAL